MKPLAENLPVGWRRERSVLFIVGYALSALAYLFGFFIDCRVPLLLGLFRMAPWLSWYNARPASTWFYYFWNMCWWAGDWLSCGPSEVNQTALSDMLVLLSAGTFVPARTLKNKRNEVKAGLLRIPCCSFLLYHTATVISGGWENNWNISNSPHYCTDGEGKVLNNNHC